MPLYPIFFILVYIAGTFVAIVKGPVWGLILYIFVYYNIPRFQWWGEYVPDLRWSLTTAGILLVSCVIHSKKLVSHKNSLNAPLILLMLLLILMTFIVPISYDIETSKKYLYDFFRYVLMFYLVGRIITDFKQYQHYVMILIACSGYLFYTAHGRHIGGRLEGLGLPDAQSANSFATLVVLIVPLMVAVALTGKLWQKGIAVMGLPFAINVLILTRSRGSFMGILMQLIVAMILFRKSKHRKKIIVGVVCVVILFSVLMDDLFKARLLELQDNIVQGESAEASAGRVAIWEYGFRMVRDFPLGAGGGGFMSLSSRYLPERSLAGTDGQRASHNTYLLILTEAGWIGFILYLGFLIVTIYLAYKIIAIKNLNTEDSETQIITLHATMLIVALSGFWTAAFFGDRIYFEGIYLIAAMVPILFRINNYSVSLLKVSKETAN